MFITSKRFDWARAYAADHNAPPKTKLDSAIKSTRLEKARALPGKTVTATELYRLDIIRQSRLKALIADGILVPVERIIHNVPVFLVADIVAYYESSEPPPGFVSCLVWAKKNHVTRGTITKAAVSGKFDYIVVDGIRYAKTEALQAWNSARAAPDGYMRCSEWFSINGIAPDTGRKLASLAPIEYVYISGAKCAKISDMELHFKPKPSQDRAS